MLSRILFSKLRMKTKSSLYVWFLILQVENIIGVVNCANLGIATNYGIKSKYC